LVEDERMVRGLVRKVLEREGFRVLEAGDGEAALAVCDRFRGKLDLVLTDVIMPKMNGHDLFEKIRADQPDVRVVFMSGYVDDALSRRAVRRGNFLFISKPFQLNELLAKVREALAGAG
jgi:two-component system cell cycle sensor histidine kinase/response regulator CckA